MARFFLLVLLLLASPAWAVNDWGYLTVCPNSRTVGGSGRICFDYNSSLSPAFTTFSVNATSALACLKGDVDQEGAVATTAVIRFCPYGSDGATAGNAANCGILVGAPAGTTLTGANGAPGAQLACVQLGPGSYRVDFPILPAVGTDVGIFTVEGSP